MGQDSRWNFLVKVARFFCVFLWSVLQFAKSRSSGYGLKDLISLHKLVAKLARSIKTDEVTSGTRVLLNKGGYGRFRGQCVKQI